MVLSDYMPFSPLSTDRPRVQRRHEFIQIEQVLRTEYPLIPEFTACEFKTEEVTDVVKLAINDTALHSPAVALADQQFGFGGDGRFYLNACAAA